MTAYEPRVQTQEQKRELDRITRLGSRLLNERLTREQAARFGGAPPAGEDSNSLTSMIAPAS